MEYILMHLLQHHQDALVKDSAISSEVIEARGYRTVEKKVEIKNRGFSEVQSNVPGLLIPVYSPGGSLATYQFRPDFPRIKDGKPRKYENPRGNRMTLDVHPHAREMLGNPSVPLFITEGVKKGDALVSQGLCAIALLGVWNWRGRNEDGGLTTLPDWEYIALGEGRPVSIVYDSDVMRNPSVYKALIRLKSFLENR